MSKIIDTRLDGTNPAQLAVFEWMTKNITNRAQARSFGLTSAAVVNGQRLTPKQLAKFNKERLDKTSKR